MLFACVPFKWDAFLPHNKMWFSGLVIFCQVWLPFELWIFGIFLDFSKLSAVGNAVPTFNKKFTKKEKPKQNFPLPIWATN